MTAKSVNLVQLVKSYEPVSQTLKINIRNSYEKLAKS